MKAKELSRRLSSFEGVYLSGFFMINPALMTSMSLLFEKIYLPNQLELVIELSKKIRFSGNILKQGEDVVIERVDSDLIIPNENPLENLTHPQQQTVKEYLALAHQFCIHNYKLFPTIFETDLLKNGEIFDVKLVEEGKNGKLNTYNVKVNPLQVTTDSIHELEGRLRKGGVPIIGIGEPNANLKLNKVSDRGIAALIAMQSIEMLLPAMKAVEPEIILEARDKLSNHLPLFWSTMLKFSKEGKNIIQKAETEEEIIVECRNLVDTTVRPILIDINEKIIKEKKNWFYKILSPLGNSLKLIVGKPNLTNFDLLSTSIGVATDTGLDFIKHKRKLDELKDEAGLTYLLKLGDVIK